MPSKCLFCGEIAVIEESIDGGKEQLICIECGSLANQSTSFKHKDDNFQKTDVTPSTVQDALGRDVGDFGPSSPQSICRSCGEVLEELPSSLGICPDCADLTEDEDDFEASDSVNTAANTGKQDLEEVRVGANTGKQDLEEVRVGEKMKDAPRCLSCKGTSLIQDSVGGDERLVCVDCGAVNSESDLNTDVDIHNPEGGYSAAKYHRPSLPRFSGEDSAPCFGMKVGLKNIANISSRLCLPTRVKTESEEMFKILFRHPKVKDVKISKKEYIGAVCVFVVCRLNDIPVFLTHFKSEVDVFSEFLKVKRFMVKRLKVHLPPVSLSSYMREVLDISNRMGGTNALTFDQSIIAKAKDIMFLLRQAWQSKGTSRNGIIGAAMYYAYVSSDGSSCISYKKFLAMSPNRHFVKARYILPCVDLLLRLANSLPWIKVTAKPVTRHSLPKHINDILKYQHTLLHLIYKPDHTDGTTESDIPEGRDDINPAESVRRKRPALPDVGDEESERFLSYPFSKRKIDKPDGEDIRIEIPSNVDLDCEILREDEFNEELDSYILSPEEQEKMKEAKLSLVEIKPGKKK